MTRTQRGIALAVIAGTLLVALPATAQALTLRQGQDVVIGKAETIDDDVYAFGSNIQIDGTVNGDVIAAGQTVVITGKVTGSVMAAGQSVRVTGEVGGAVRASGADVTIDGPVAHDVLASGGAVRIGADGRVARDAALAGGTVTILGEVRGNAYLAATTASIQGNVSGNASVQASQITVAGPSKIGGDLEYWSDAKPDISGTVAGKTVAHPAQRDANASGTTGSNIAAGLLGWLRGLVGWVLFGLLCVLVLPGVFARAAEGVIARMWPSLGVGFVAMVVPPIFALPLLIVTVLIGGWWIVVLLMALWAVLLSAGFVAGVGAVGQLLGRRMSSPPGALLAMLLGLAVVWVLSAIPFLGGLFTLAATLFGTGALAMQTYGALRRKGPEAMAVAPAAESGAGEA